MTHTHENLKSWGVLKRGAFRQRSAIGALVFKEFKVKLGNSRIGLVWALLEPLVGMMMISMIWYILGRETIQGTHVTLFIGSGFIIFIGVRQGINYIPLAIAANQALLNYPQVKPIDTVLARFIQGMWLHALASILMLSGLWWIFDISAPFPDPLLCVTTVCLALMLALGISLPLAVVGTINENIMKTINLFSMPLVFVSGVIYSVYEMSASIRSILKWNPIVHLVSGFRHGAFGSKLFPEYSLLYPFLFGLTSLGFGYALYYYYRFRLIRQ